ncbi:molybdenum cofactor guanylyltransferase [Gymnodinialimonas ceratoperidinii]|uniref:Molybdenum cofactor guanylyltransferase n=1 Tax=Gymnodinialimonas ceratoperidinii TaxID=2856823 RepID=A0A8F6YCJ4_9RHOB|nr:molybdenum cofactor guanylyltransferase [Gymnodinialimonas ceratoperidinii]
MPAVILAGGAGRRIGGGKPDVLLAGKPLWQHVADRIAPQVAALAINGPMLLEGYPQVEDTRPGLGPLSGVLSAMLWAREEGATRVLTVAVDTPFLPPDLVARLQSASAPIVMARTTDGTHGTTALWDVTLADDLEGYLEGGGRKVTAWAETHAIAYADFPETAPPPFFNINTPEDLARAEAWV